MMRNDWNRRIELEKLCCSRIYGKVSTNQLYCTCTQAHTLGGRLAIWFWFWTRSSPYEENAVLRWTVPKHRLCGRHTGTICTRNVNLFLLNMCYHHETRQWHTTVLIMQSRNTLYIAKRESNAGGYAALCSKWLSWAQCDPYSVRS